MGYSGRTNPTPPRSLRVILGATLAIACLISGTMMGTHHYHRALSMGNEPDVVDWHTLTAQGLSDNAFVCLTNVRLDDVNANHESIDQYPTTPPNEWNTGVANTDVPMAAFDSALRPVKVLPLNPTFNANPNAVAVTKLGEKQAEVLIPPHSDFPEIARQQLAATGSISGYVSTYDGAKFMDTVLQLVGSETEEFADNVGALPRVFTLEPMDAPLDKASSELTFWLLGLGVAMGLIICGSGGPSLVCCIFFSVPALLSLAGYPMRYGRGRTITRLIYVGIGVALMGYGYQLMIVQGRFGSPNGNPIYQALGFLSTFVGLAAFLSVPIQIGLRKLIGDTDERASKKSKLHSCDAAPSPETETPDSTLSYRDLDLAPSDVELPDEMQQMVESLAPLGFTAPIDVKWHDNELTIPSAIQLGCQGVVVCDIDVFAREVQTRLVSVLHDGLTLITVSRNSPVQRDSCMGTNGFYVAAKTNNPIEMMSLHLEETVTMAEKRNTTVVKIDPDEIQHVCLLGRRVLADIRAENGEEEMQVQSKPYGRFTFPAQRIIGELASAS